MRRGRCLGLSVDPDISEIPEAIAGAKATVVVPLVSADPDRGRRDRRLARGQVSIKKGPTITISFKTAEGLEAGKTKIKYKNVDVGEVKMIKLSEDRQSVVATTELVKEAEPHLVEDTRFWVVRPRVAGGQVSGLGTLFPVPTSGWTSASPTSPVRVHRGLDMPPIITGDLPGRQLSCKLKKLWFAWDRLCWSITGKLEVGTVGGSMSQQGRKGRDAQDLCAPTLRSVCDPQHRSGD